MSSTSYDINSSPGNTHMSEAILELDSNQPLITTNDIDTTNEEKQLLSNQDNSLQNPIDNIPLESISPNITKKQESLISVYDNSNDGEQQQKQQTNQNSFPLVGILGRNRRSQAFTKRLLLSGFPKPILCDRNSVELEPNEKSNYVSYETFCKQSPSIIIITDNLTSNFEDLFNQDKPQLIIDARESIKNKVSKKSSHTLIPIPRSHRAFGNISNWEIESGTTRVGVAIEQASPLNLIKFIHDLKCFSRGIYFLDQYTYNNEEIKSFRNCLFPLVSTIIIFSSCFILSIIEHDHHKYSQPNLVYRQASSIVAATSITLLSLLFLISPLLELIDLMYSLFCKKRKQKNVVPHLLFIQRWLQSRRYLAWYSLTFAFLHFIFLLFSKIDFNQKSFFPLCFGLCTLILLCILSFVHFPWISERLLWHEYHLLTSYLGPFSVLTAFIHVYINWKYGYYYASRKHLFNLKFLSMLLPLIVLLLRLIVFGIIHPTIKLIHWSKSQQRKTQTATIATKDTSLLP